MSKRASRKGSTRVLFAIPPNKWGVRRSDLRRLPCERVDEKGNTVSTYDQVPTALAKAGERMEEVWLWCLHCRRFFQAKHLKLDPFGNWQQCPFDDCGAAGFDVDIMVWECGKGVDRGWPHSAEELTFGRSSLPPARSSKPAD